MKKYKESSEKHNLKKNTIITFFYANFRCCFLMKRHNEAFGIRVESGVQCVTNGAENSSS